MRELARRPQLFLTLRRDSLLPIPDCLKVDGLETLRVETASEIELALRVGEASPQERELCSDDMAIGKLAVELDRPLRKTRRALNRSRLVVAAIEYPPCV